MYLNFRQFAAMKSRMYTLPYKTNHLFASQVPTRMFAREVIGDNTPLLDQDLFKKELEAFEKLPEEKKKELALQRKAMLKVQELIVSDPKNWQNKLIEMNREQIQLLPLSFLKKYNSYITQFKSFK